MNLITPSNTLAEARQWLRRRVRQGTKCPCCQQHAKIYKRSLNSSMAHALVLLYRELGATGNYIHAAHFLMRQQATVANGDDYAKLVQFGLLEQMPRTMRGQDVSGLFRLTEKAIAFVENRERVEKYIYLYDGKFLDGYGDDETKFDRISIEETLVISRMPRHRS